MFKRESEIAVSFSDRPADRHFLEGYSGITKLPAASEKLYSGKPPNMVDTRHDQNFKVNLFPRGFQI
jgi:hypothetical protein